MKKNMSLKTCGLFSLFFCLGCSACSFQDSEELLMEPDLSPPRLLEVLPTDSPEVLILFDEPVKVESESISLESGETALLTVSDETSLVLMPQNPLIPGIQYKASLCVEDLRGNSCRFVLMFWGWNPRVPDLLINEFNPEGSENNPDCIELYARSDGNTAGMCLYYGTRRFYEYRYVLPNIEVQAGDYLIIHCRRDFLSDEISESQDKTQSGGKLSSDNAWDLWIPEDQGLSGANGILTLYNAPKGSCWTGLCTPTESRIRKTITWDGPAGPSMRPPICFRWVPGCSAMNQFRPMKPFPLTTRQPPGHCAGAALPLIQMK